MNPFRTEARGTDIEQVRRIVRDTGFFREDEVDVAIELVADRLARSDASDYFFVFADSDSGNLDGYACFGPIACTVGSFDLYWIVVARHRQGAGLGRRLLRAAEEAIARRGGRRIYIETSSQPLYEPTRSFYERCGYTLEATLRDFYDTGDDKLVYARALRDATDA